MLFREVLFDFLVLESFDFLVVFNNLTFGVIGYGRLGSLYSDYCLAFGSEVIVYDPYKKTRDISNFTDLDGLRQKGLHQYSVEVFVIS